MLISNSVANTTSPMSPSTQSVTNSATRAPTSITTVPTANGIGAIEYQAASTSEFAFDSRVPVACWRCQAMGSSR